MAAYAVFVKLTPAGRKSLSANPGRLDEVVQQAEKLGARVVQNFATIGEYDFVTIIEAPDNLAVSRIEAEISSLGTTRLMAHPAIAMPRFVELLKIQPYRTEPHTWQTALWARVARRAGRYWVTTRHVKRYCHPLTIEGREHLKKFKGGAIIIANHSSHFDTPVVLSSLPESLRSRTVIAAAADKFYGSRKKRTWWYSLFMNTFPVHRGGGTKQLDYPKSLLGRGWSILIYPEGGRSKSGQIARFKAGPALMAMAAGVPVIPVYIEGLRNVMPKGQRTPQPAAVHARIGAPVSLEGITSVSEATAALENAMRTLAGMLPHQSRRALPADAEMAAAPAGGGS